MRAANPPFNYFRTNFRAWTRPAVFERPKAAAGAGRGLCAINCPGYFFKLGCAVAPAFTLNESPCTTLLRCVVLMAKTQHPSRFRRAVLDDQMLYTVGSPSAH